MKNKNIIKKNHHFQNIISNKKYLKSQSFVIYYSDKKDTQFKYGISVGKKLGNAIFRNKIKRQVRNMVYQLLPNLISKHTEIIIMARKNITKATYEENTNELDLLLKKIK